MLSALVLFVVSGLATPVPEPVRHGIVVAAAVLGVLRDVGAVSFPLPQNARQVPQDVLRRDVVRGALRFGFEMGTGVRTYVSSTVPYVLVVALLLTAPGIATAIAAGVGFGLGRALTPTTRYASGDGETWDDALHAHVRGIKVAAGLAVAAALVFLLFAAR
ncbi:hypothetical protein [Actinophytocola gossypii]|uniref:DUF1772 domain-containing protein n=1 Tax=Actinophytocola gossypii TaxID=2812003 RepID=A0ABT2J3Z3_9PSEU|nr:hypothetical protein [Actinophytocola gossypii]MCT2582220.1 hypothetical protein [Actinophytocola gossypii]